MSTDATVFDQSSAGDGVTGMANDSRHWRTNEERETFNL